MKINFAHSPDADDAFELFSFKKRENSPKREKSKH